MCLEEGPDESGKHLRRDCSCRGESAGFAHLSCLVTYAVKKNEDWDGRELDQFIEPWVVCPRCCQPYQNELSLDLADSFVTYVEETYPGDEWKLVEALIHKLDLAVGFQKAQEVACKILHTIERMKSSDTPLAPRIREIEGTVYCRLGCISFQEGTVKSARAAVKYLEKFRDISNANGSDIGVAMAEANIAFAKSKYKGESNVSKEELVANHKKLYEKFVAALGESAQHSIESGINYAGSLWSANQGVEAKKLLAELVAKSKQVHGQDHRLTKIAASMLSDMQS